MNWLWKFAKDQSTPENSCEIKWGLMSSVDWVIRLIMELVVQYLSTMLVKFQFSSGLKVKSDLRVVFLTWSLVWRLSFETSLSKFFRVKIVLCGGIKSVSSKMLILFLIYLQYSRISVLFTNCSIMTLNYFKPQKQPVCAFSVHPVVLNRAVVIVVLYTLDCIFWHPKSDLWFNELKFELLLICCSCQFSVPLNELSPLLLTSITFLYH